MIGIALMSNLPNEGVFASSGMSPRIAFTLRCASCKARSTSASFTSSTVIREKPSMLVELIFFTPSSEESASSNFFVTVFSTSPGEAPG